MSNRKDGPETGEHKHVCCRLGSMLVGIPLDRVQEINRLVEPTFVPLMEPYLRGVINLRGNLVTVLDLGVIVRGEPTSTSSKARTVVVEVGEEICGLCVDEVGDVVEVAAADTEALPSHLPAQQRRWFRGMVQLPQQLLLLLDVASIGAIGATPGPALGAR
ncbi:MAG: chemotaxis protein CheW [Planctomycetes bacterium]|nr:chemotaxis protein CheW [Planctomycetota bacterium]